MKVEFDNFEMECDDNRLVDLNHSGTISGANWCPAKTALKNGNVVWDRESWLIRKYSKP